MAKNTETWGRDKAAERYARGGHVKHKPHVAVNIHMPPPSGQADAMSAPLPSPGSMGAPGPAMGVPPVRPGGAGPFARGGKVPMKAGADSGPGRIDKIKAYGLKPLKGS